MKFLSNSIRKIRRRDSLKLIKGRANCINYSDNTSKQFDFLQGKICIHSAVVTRAIDP